MSANAAGEFPIRILQSWGVASARHTSGGVVPSTPSQAEDTELLFDVPIGPSILRWDIARKCRVAGQQFQAHRDLVTCMRRSPSGRFVATSCYSGGVRLWRGEEWECVDEIEAPMASQHHLAWSHDSNGFVVVGNGTNSSIVMYTVEENPLSNKAQLKQLWQVSAGEDLLKIKGQRSKVSNEHPPHVPEFECLGNNPSGCGQEEKARSTRKDYNYIDAFYMAEITPTGNVLAIEERRRGDTLVQLYHPDGRLLRVRELDLEAGERGERGSERLHTLFISSYKDGCYAIGIQGGFVMLVDAETLEVVSSFKVGYTSRTCVWDGDALVLPSDSGKLSWWSTNGEKLHEFKVGSADSIVRLDWSVSGHALWMCGVSALSYLQVSKKADGSISGVAPAYAIHSHEISCCGVGFSPSGRYVAVGDLAGNVWVTEGMEEKTKYKCSVGMSVRCIVWYTDTVVLVGCLGGLVHQWSVEEGTEGEGDNLRKLFSMDGSIIHMGWNHTQEFLAVGTSKGVVGIYGRPLEKVPVHPLTTFTAHRHKDGKQDLRFGQLNKQAEVWSLCWSPDDSMLATCSEDQSTKIWDTGNWTCLATLTGHSMAVTSVDWKMVGGRSVLATCADDRTIRVIDGHTFSLLHIFNTKEIYGWHTLTYLTFDPAKDSPRLVCTTQNGHMVAWDILSGKKIVCGKLHCGSVEGLSWDPVNNRIATVGGDCIAHLMTIG